MFVAVALNVSRFLVYWDWFRRHQSEFGCKDILLQITLNVPGLLVQREYGLRLKWNLAVVEASWFIRRSLVISKWYIQFIVLDFQGFRLVKSRTGGYWKVIYLIVERKGSHHVRTSFLFSVPPIYNIFLIFSRVLTVWTSYPFSAMQSIVLAG